MTSQNGDQNGSEPSSLATNGQSTSNHQKDTQTNNNNLNSVDQYDSEMAKIDTDTIHGILVTYEDDQLNECVKSPLKRKQRVRYKCMDTLTNYLAFGTSGGAVYLFRMDPLRQEPATLLTMIPCDQGSIEVVRLLPVQPNPNSPVTSQMMDELMIAIGTNRGSLVVFWLAHQPTGGPVSWRELYRATEFADNWPIKFLEYDRDLLDPMRPFSRLYICDQSSRLYSLDRVSLGQAGGLRAAFYYGPSSSGHAPSPTPLFRLNESRVHQVSVQRTQLLISSDHFTWLYDESGHAQPRVIGSKKRRPGFYGACFFSEHYRPVGQPLGPGGPERDQLLVFVSRPAFRLWHVNERLEVKFTHQFGSLIANFCQGKLVPLRNVALRPGEPDESDKLLSLFSGEPIDRTHGKRTNSDHFERLLHIYSPSLGNLLLSYTQHELHVLDPIQARLIVAYSSPDSIVQVSCNQNELFVWTSSSSSSSSTSNLGSSQITGNGSHTTDFRLQRLVLMAPTQLVLELHRLHRLSSLVSFIERFAELFCERMALPLSGNALITTEGGLLRAVLWNAWQEHLSPSLTAGSQNVNNKKNRDEDDDDVDNYDEDTDEQKHLRHLESRWPKFRDIVDEISRESRQLRQSVERPLGSRFLLSTTQENLARLCSEPYLSLVSLDVSLGELHNSHVIHFSKDAISRHRSLANLSQSIRSSLGSSIVLEQEVDQDTSRGGMASTNRRTVAKSTADLRSSRARPLDAAGRRSPPEPILVTAEVAVERRLPSRRRPVQKLEQQLHPVGEASINERVSLKTVNTNAAKPTDSQDRYFSSAQMRHNLQQSSSGSTSSLDADKQPPCSDELAKSDPEETNKMLEQDQFENDDWRCPDCHWPLQGHHLRSAKLTSSGPRLRWLEENLMSHFEEKIESIEEFAFKHALWPVYLRCLSYKNRLEDYVTCCMMLDDVRLLEVKQFVIARCGDQQIFGCLLERLAKRELSTTSGQCLHCSADLKTGCMEADSATELIQTTAELNSNRFSLVTMVETFLRQRGRAADLKRIIGRLLDFPELLNKSHVPASFYLNRIKEATSASSQRRLSVSLSRHPNNMRQAIY